MVFTRGTAGWHAPAFGTNVIAGIAGVIAGADGAGGGGTIIVVSADFTTAATVACGGGVFRIGVDGGSGITSTADPAGVSAGVRREADGATGWKSEIICNVSITWGECGSGRGTEAEIVYHPVIVIGEFRYGVDFAVTFVC